MKVSEIKHRVIWTFNPITRVVQSKKDYKRAKSKVVVRQEIRLT